VPVVLALWVIAAAAVVGCGVDNSSNDGRRISAQQVLQGLQAAGLPIGTSVEFTAATDPNGLLGEPGGYIEKITFRDTRIPPDGDGLSLDSGGTIEVFESNGDAEARKRRLDTAAAGIRLGTEFSWVEGSVLLRVSPELEPEEARKYEDAL